MDPTARFVLGPAITRRATQIYIQSGAFEQATRYVESDRGVVVLGPPRTGKTSLLHHLTEEWSDKKHKGTSALLRLQELSHSSRSLFVASLLCSLSAELGAPPSVAPRLGSSDTMSTAELSEIVREFIGEAAKQTSKLLLCVDEFNVFAEPSHGGDDNYVRDVGVAFLRGVQRALHANANVSIVVASNLPIEDVLPSAEIEEWREFPLVRMADWTREQLGGLRRAFRSLKNKRDQNMVLDAIFAAVGGQPLLSQYLASAADVDPPDAGIALEVVLSTVQRWKAEGRDDVGYVDDLRARLRQFGTTAAFARRLILFDRLLRSTNSRLLVHADDEIQDAYALDVLGLARVREQRDGVSLEPRSAFVAASISLRWMHAQGLLSLRPWLSAQSEWSRLGRPKVVLFRLYRWLSVLPSLSAQPSRSLESEEIEFLGVLRRSLAVPFLAVSVFALVGAIASVRTWSTPGSNVDSTVSAAQSSELGAGAGQAAGFSLTDSGASIRISDTQGIAVSMPVSAYLELNRQSLDRCRASSSIRRAIGSLPREAREYVLWLEQRQCGSVYGGPGSEPEAVVNSVGSRRER